MLWGRTEIAKEDDRWEADDEAETKSPRRPKRRSVHLL
jgi:hypothetical protein